MGNTYEICVWGMDEMDGYCGYMYKEFWRGQSILVALWKFFEARRAGYECVKLVAR